MLKKEYCLLLMVVVFSYSAHSQNMLADTSFANAGVFSLKASETQHGIKSVCQPDGKILILSEFGDSTYPFRTDRLFVYRLNYDGSLDSAFGDGGKVMIRGYPEPLDPYVTGADLEYMPDGRILIAGTATFSASSDPFIVRLLNDGSYDSSFESDGIAMISLPDDMDVTCMYVQPDKKILIAGSDYYWMFVARFDSNGVLDYTFDSDGITNLSIYIINDEFSDIDMQVDGKIVLSGQYGTASGSPSYKPFIARLNVDGSFDTGFNGSGYVICDLGGPYTSTDYVRVMPSGKLLMCGQINEDLFMARFMSDGSPDLSFGVGGIVQDALPTAELREHNYVYYLNGDFSIFTSYSQDVAYTMPSYSARYLPYGNQDASFGFPNIGFSGTADRISHLTRQADGKFLVTGYTQENYLDPEHLEIRRYIPGFSVDAEPANDLNLGVEVYPLPVTGHMFFLDAQVLSGNDVELSLWDCNGRKVINDFTAKFNASGMAEIQLPPTVAPGLYLLRNTTTDYSWSLKIIVK